MKENKLEEVWVKTEDIDFNEFNPNQMAPEKYAALKESIKKDGIQQQILVRAKGERFELIDGANRTKIAKELKIPELRATIKDVGDRDAMRLCYKVNANRGTIDCFKEAVFFDLLAQKGLNEKDTAKEYGLSEQFIKDRKKLLSINQEQKELLLKKVHKSVELTGAHWLVYAKATPEERTEVCKDVGRHHPLFVRDFEWQIKRARDEIKRRKEFETVLEKAKFKTCPTCKEKAVSLDWQKHLRCEKHHDWNPNTGKTNQRIIGEKYQGKDKKKTLRFPRAVYTDITIKEAKEKAQKEILKNIGKLSRISFYDKKGILWAVNFGYDFLKLSKGTKQYTGEEYTLYDRDGKKRIEIPRYQAPSKKYNDEAKAWLKWLGAKEVERPAKTKKKKEGKKK